MEMVTTYKGSGAYTDNETKSQADSAKPAPTPDSTGGALPTSATTKPGGATNVPATPKETMKESQKEESKKDEPKPKGIPVVDVYHTEATGDTPEKPQLSYTNRTADYYRNGIYDLDGNMTTLPRQYEPYEGNDAASIRIFGLKDNADMLPAYTKFILDSVQESHTERSQIVETFGDFYVFMFGERPPVYNFSGTLINAKNASWVTDFMFMYDMYLRGTRCVENNAITLVTYGGRQVEGLILSTSNQTSAAVEGGVPFQFSVVVFERRYYNFSPDMGYVMGKDDKLSVDKKFVDMLNKVAGKDGKGTSTEGLSTAIQATKSVTDGAPAKGAISGSGK